ncbi:MAG TPA: leucyl aminopeptidase [Candidatus Paceibacterota bacterium]
MKISLATTPAKKDGLVFFLFDKEDITKKLLFGFLDKEEKAYVQKIRSALGSKAQEVKVAILPGSMRRAIFVGMGGQREFNPRKAGIAMRMVMQTARQEKIASLAFSALPVPGARDTRDMYEILATNAVMGNFEFITYKTPPPEGFFFVKTLTFVASKLDANIREGLRRGAIIGEETNACRALSNTPGEDMTPAILAAHAVKVARINKIKATVLDVKKMIALKMGAVLAVGSGSDAPPRFIVLEYMKGPKKEKTVVLVGKGVTFDTGGLNLKPSEHIYEMHMDMSGGAAVIHTIAAAARLKLKKNIVALVPAVENMPSGSSYRPGDLIRTMSGKTIEVLNTDAEGRVILADALQYAKKYDPSLVIDVATLTGAAVSALGLFYSGLFTTDKKLETVFRTIGESVDDRVWPLPLSEDYEDGIKGTFGDWANTGRKGEGGDASNGAAFLSQFIKGYRWVHFDIAPRMVSIKQDFLAQGAVGTPVRLLIRFLSEDH